MYSELLKRDIGNVISLTVTIKGSDPYSICEPKYSLCANTDRGVSIGLHETQKWRQGVEALKRYVREFGLTYQQVEEIQI